MTHRYDTRRPRKQYFTLQCKSPQWFVLNDVPCVREARLKDAGPGRHRRGRPLLLPADDGCSPVVAILSAGKGGRHHLPESDTAVSRRHTPMFHNLETCPLEQLRHRGREDLVVEASPRQRDGAHR